MGALTWNNHSHTLTPSQHWREFNTRAQAHESSPHRLIVNMYSDDKSAMWFLPILGGSMIATGDHDMLIFSDAAIVHNHGDVACESYYDTLTFTASSMCCACGGGQTIFPSTSSSTTCQHVAPTHLDTEGDTCTHYLKYHRERF